MNTPTHRVAIIGCGRQGQCYAEAYSTYPDTSIVALVEPHAERRHAVAKRFGIDAHFADVSAMLAQVVPDVAAIVTPVRYTKEAVIACAEAGVKGISVEKPIGGVLADVDAMIDACTTNGVVFSGGCLQSAMHEVQEVATRLRRGDYGAITAASVHGFCGEIVGGGCQHIGVLRLLTGAEVDRVTAWATPDEAVDDDIDGRLSIHGMWRLTSGIDSSVFGRIDDLSSVEVWNESVLIRWSWGPPEIYVGHDAKGRRQRIDPDYAAYEYNTFGYMTGSIRSLLRAIETGEPPWITGADLRCALEVAIASRESARLGHAEIRLPLQDRSLHLYPSPYRWGGGDVSGRPQSLEEASGNVGDS